MIRINEDKCIGCGLCANECNRKLLAVVDGKATVLSENCYSCFHCYCICPVKAIEFTDTDVDGEIEVSTDDGRLNPDKLLAAIKTRRAIRSFADTPVSDDKIHMILEAARFTPSGGNLQTNRLTVIKDQMKEIKGELIDILGWAAANPEEANTPLLPRYTQIWTNMYNQYHEQNIDKLFYNAPVVITISGKNAIDAALAASNAELMAFAEGLGCIYIGFMNYAGNRPEMKKRLGIPEDEEVFCTLAVGYSVPQFLRSAPRKIKEVNYL